MSTTPTEEDVIEPSRSGRRPRLRRQSSAEQVATHVRQLIVRGELHAGDRLRQDDIAAELGVSRIPVREAIVALDREGWVRFEANRGAFVSGLAADDIRDHYELRGIVLELVVERVGRTATDEDLRELQQLRKAMVSATDVEAFSAQNDRWLARLLTIADSPRLRAALLVTPSIIPEDFFQIVDGGRTIQEKGVTQVLRHLKARRGTDAGRAMRTTLARQGEAVVATFERTGLLG